MNIRNSEPSNLKRFKLVIHVVVLNSRMRWRGEDAEHLFRLFLRSVLTGPMFIYQIWHKLLCQVVCSFSSPFTILTCISWPPHLFLKFQSDLLLVIQGTTPTCPAQLCIRTQLLTNLFSPRYVRAPQMLMKWYLTSRDVLEFALLLVGRRIILGLEARLYGTKRRRIWRTYHAVGLYNYGGLRV